MYRTILVPLDGSSLAERALPYARAVAWAGRAHLILLQAVEPTPLAAGEPGNRAKALADAEAYLAGLFPGPSPASPVTVSVSVGDAGAAILEETRSRGVALSSDSLEVEEQAATALGHLGGPAATEALVHARESRHDVSSLAITRAPVQIGMDAVPRLIDVLASPDAAARWRAAEVLADVGDPRAVEPFVRALDDPDQAVRWNAARGLARMERSGLEAVLRALATRPLTPWLAQGARYVLHRAQLSHRSRRLPALLAALGHPSASVEVPVRAAEALAEIQGLEAVV